VNVDVLRFYLAVKRAIRGHANPFGRTVAAITNNPTLILRTNRDTPPELCVFYFVVFVQIVDIKTTDVGKNFFNTEITPMIFGITDDMPVGARRSNVVPLFL
jgi:hypothetical protein